VGLGEPTRPGVCHECVTHKENGRNGTGGVAHQEKKVIGGAGQGRAAHGDSDEGGVASMAPRAPPKCRVLLDLLMRKNKRW
jgi:hypothetical protein